jgi:hypothetical protein
MTAEHAKPPSDASLSSRVGEPRADRDPCQGFQNKNGGANYEHR